MIEPAAALQPIPFRMLIDEAVRLVRRHFRVIYWPIAVPVALAQLLVLVAQAGLLAQGPALPLGVAGFGCVTLLSLFALIVFTYLAYGVMEVAAVDAVAGREVQLGPRWRFIVRGNVLGTLMLVGLCIAGGFLLCFFPAVYVFLLLSFVIPVMAEEGQFGGDALRRSSELVRYNPERRFVANPMVKVFVIFLVGGIISYAVSFLVQAPFVIAQLVITFRQAAEGGAPTGFQAWEFALQAPAQVLGSLVQTAVQLYVAFALALFYFDVRKRREGFDLEAAIDQLAGPAGGGPGRAGPVS